MSFEARRLRVQLPDGSKVVFVGPDDAEAADHSIVPGDAQKIILGVCVDQWSWNYGSCLDDFTRYLVVQQGPGVISSVSPEALPALREHLEEQLRNVGEAEQAMKAGPAE